MTLWRSMCVQKVSLFHQVDYLISQISLSRHIEQSGRTQETDPGFLPTTWQNVCRKPQEQEKKWTKMVMKVCGIPVLNKVQKTAKNLMNGYLRIQNIIFLKSSLKILSEQAAADSRIATPNPKGAIHYFVNVLLNMDGIIKT